MNIEKTKINVSMKDQGYEQFLLDLNKITSFNKDIEIIFEKLYSDFNLKITFLPEYLTEEEIETTYQGYNSPLKYQNMEDFGFLPNQGRIENAPKYNYSDLNILDFYIHETGHMIDYYLSKRILNKDTENYSIYDTKLKDFVSQTINYYESNELPESIVDYFNTSNDYKKNPSKKYQYESLSDIITLITKGKYFDVNYHKNMDVTKWNKDKFLIYGHDMQYLQHLEENETETDIIIKEIFANYISICLLPNEDAYKLLKEITNGEGENLQDVMNNFIADTVKKL